MQTEPVISIALHGQGQRLTVYGPLALLRQLIGAFQQEGRADSEDGAAGEGNERNEREEARE